MNETHRADVESWVESANDPTTDFPIQNLPFGVFRQKGKGGRGRIGVALGDSIIDVEIISRVLPFEGQANTAAELCHESSLNSFMEKGGEYWSALRKSLFDRFDKSAPDAKQNQKLLESTLVPMERAEMLVPVEIGDYTDFYTSIFHATNVGGMFRPDNPLLPNYKYVPIAYHGRSSSVVASGSEIRRPMGQTKGGETEPPVFRPTRLFDYELEVGIFIGPGNQLGQRIDIQKVDSHIFGLGLLNDWSARDIQKWEYQPLGPFLAKNFATTVSPWIVTLEALEPFRSPAFQRADGDPPPLPYLTYEIDQASGAFEVTLDVFISSAKMREIGMEPVRLSRSNLSDLYWTIAQMVTHHASNGCNLRPGDLLGSGTVSGESKESRGCLLELTWRGEEPIKLPTGEERKFLADGDEVIMKGFCEREGYKRIGFGECTGTVLPALTD